jgi:hypothetical protein
MVSNTICGATLTKYTAQYLLELSQALYNNITFALDCDSRYGLAQQEQTTWTVRSARKPEPIDDAIVIMKGKIASHHVSVYEEWKETKYSSAVNWPWSSYGESLWSRVSHAMNLPMCEARNWFSHHFGKRKTKLEEEQEHWKTLLQEYKDLLPVVSELVEKLEAALDDEAAWVQEGGALTNAKTQPRYAYECVAVLMVIAAAHQKSRAQKRQALLDKLDYAARKEYELKLPWKYQPWIQRDVSEAELDSEDDKVEETVCKVATGDDDQGIDLDLWDNVSDSEEDYTHEYTEGFHDPVYSDDWAYEMDWYDDAGYHYEPDPNDRGYDHGLHHPNSGNNDKFRDFTRPALRKQLDAIHAILW